MVDIVANHVIIFNINFKMGNLDQNYGQNVPFNSPDHYHNFCIISDNDFATKNQYNI